ncbi:DNA mismatch repair ATPase MutS [Bacilli bacterium PM5-9]|nr:DNA mismatch repair ATPase MutS [Bacilli bacterium PM5-9]
MKRDYYQEKTNLFLENLIVTNKKSQTISLIRFIVFVLFAGCALLGIYDKKVMFLIPTFLFLGVFIYLVIWHSKIEWQQKLEKSSLKICEDYLKRFDYQWQDFSNVGGQFVNDALFICRDLDIIGKNSLYQYLVLAKSNKGQQKLFNSLTSFEISNDASSIHELASNKDLHLKLSSLINMYDNKKSDLILNDNKSLDLKTKKVYYFLANIYSIFVLGVLALALFNVISLSYLIAILILNAIIVLVKFNSNKNYLASIHKNHNNLDIVLKVIKEIEQADFESIKLKNIKDTLTRDFNASNSINKLIKLKERLESQSNALLYFFAEVLLLWDYRNVLYYDTWKKTLGKNAQQYLEIFYDFEVMLSLAIIEQTKEEVVDANVKVSNYPYLNATGLYHPLLNNENVIANDFNTQAQTTIITGSNMSGKTTFIRSIGINMLLAYSGAMVCAKKFDVTLMKIFTSIRVEDNMNDGISTFYAEINRIKEMVQAQEEGQVMLCLIDEIFKGTNSEDRIYGAKETIKHLTKPYCINFVTTHDAQLCEIKNIVNYHFEEFYENDEIMFNYVIKKGVSKTRNAKYLLKMAGIVK